MQVEWRAVTEGDAATLAPVLRATLAQELEAGGLPAVLVGSLVELQQRGREASWSAAYPGLERRALLVDGEVVGQAVLHRGPTVLTLVDLVVAASRRGMGIGEAVLHKVQQEAAGLAVRLTVRQANPARRLYARVGFVEVGRDDVQVFMAWRA
jgi:ribosomal protein S18 acetylase RimI-like enzyme